MQSDYNKIREDNIQEYGKGTRHLSFWGQLYTDRTHFVFELLQNAEDASASQILFTLLNDRLEVAHDGRRFNEQDVRGVCGVGEGTKAEDLSQIGKFGIGFKSVYAYTTKPEIHSGDEHFRVENYVRPYAVPKRKIDNPLTTLFVFVFDIPNFYPETACQEIGICLRNLSARTLLFLRKIKQIKYKLLDTDGIYRRDEVTQGSPRRVEILGQNNVQDEDENWLIFERPVEVPDKSVQIPVEVGFRLETNTKDKKECIIREKNSWLIVYFPTEKDTRLGFLIQGPYRTTPARDNIPKDDDWNKKLLKATAELVAESLRQLKERDLLTVSLLEALPLRKDDFSENSMFYPIFSRVRETLINEELLPANDGGFVTARNAKLVRGATLMKILNQKQLGALFQSDDDIKWLPDNITQNRTHDLHFYLTKELEVEEVDPEAFAHHLSEQFLASQDDEWFIKLYEYLSDQKALWRPPRWSYDTMSGILRDKPILRLQNGAQVNPFRSDGSPNAYLATGTDSDTSLPIVKVTLSSHDGARQFLSQLGIGELDLVAEVVERILPKYTDDSVKVESEENKRDLKKIEQAYKTDSQKKQSRLRDSLIKTPFILADRSHERGTTYRRPDEIYFGSDELCEYFSGNNSFTYVSLDHPQESLFKELGVKNAVRIFRKPKDRLGYVCIKDDRGSHERGLDGFDPDIHVDGLECAVSEPTLGKSAFIWEKIAIPNSDCIRGVVEKSTRGNYDGSSKEKQLSEFGKLLTDNAWLPDSNGNMYKPSDLSFDDLHESFVRNETLANQLDMKKDIDAELADKAGISKTTLDRAKQIENAPLEVQQKIDCLLQGENQKQPPFPEKISADSKRRKKQLTEQYDNATIKEFDEHEKIVQILRDIIDHKIWLRDQYSNSFDQMICQICQEEMPFKKRDGEYYFEAVEALSKDYFPKDLKAQFLALCPLCAARYEEFVKRDKPAMKELLYKLKNSDDLLVPLKLGELETSLRFVEIHRQDMKTILDLSNTI